MHFGAKISQKSLLPVLLPLSVLTLKPRFQGEDHISLRDARRVRAVLTSGRCREVVHSGAPHSRFIRLNVATTRIAKERARIQRALTHSSVVDLAVLFRLRRKQRETIDIVSRCVDRVVRDVCSDVVCRFNFVSDLRQLIRGDMSGHVWRVPRSRCRPNLEISVHRTT